MQERPPCWGPLEELLEDVLQNYDETDYSEYGPYDSHGHSSSR
jgi:hypothetical protein